MIGLTDRFEQALAYAARLHRGQSRKGLDVPYVSHLLGVAALVLEDGGDEDQAIAALLHDAAEDQGGKPTVDAIRQVFGDRVARIVDGCTDTYDSPKPPWRERKECYLAHLPGQSSDVLRVSLADKLYNARTIVTAQHGQGDTVWERFNGKKEGSLWYYRALSEVFCRIYPGSMADELARVVNQMVHLAEMK